jgi:transposase-like protein
MGEAESARGAAVDNNGNANGHRRGTDEIRAEIEQTRQELGETVEALAAKTDVKAHAKAKVDEATERAKTLTGDPKVRLAGAVAVVVLVAVLIARRARAAG